MSETPSDEERPEWWQENSAIREAMGLPAYDPPRFVDGTYTHEVVDDLEARRDCEIRFRGVNTQYGDDWEVIVDGTSVLSLGRHRDENGNTVYETTAEAFLDALEDALGERP